MTFSLPGVCLITGAASGIGRGTAISIAQEGCSRLFLADIELDGLRKTRQYIREADEGVRVEILQVDIADEKCVQEMIHKCVSTFGRVDYALNIAGVVPQRTPIADVNVETYDKVVHINQHGTWLCHRAEIIQMMKQEPLEGHGTTRGSIISVSSLAGINASSGMSVYCASKHSIIGFAKADAQDYGPHGIRVNVICPGMIDTDLFRATSPPEAPAALTAITPVRRLGNPSDVAWLAAFLCSAKSSFIHGSVIPCDGGLALQRGVI